jgi:hypothetical protein
VAENKRAGLTLSTGILQPTTRPEPEPARLPRPEPAEQGGEPPADDTPNGAKASRERKKKTVPVGSDRTEDMKLYLSEDVRFRLRMLAFKRNAKISTVANEVLDKALPRWTLERTE